MDDAAEWTNEALSRAAYLASFILLMALLREGALTSRSVIDLGRFLTFQPPQRRFVAVFSGAHVLSVMINLGALSLLASIVQRGVRTDLPPGAPLGRSGGNPRTATVDCHPSRLFLVSRLGANGNNTSGDADSDEGY